MNYGAPLIFFVSFLVSIGLPGQEPLLVPRQIDEHAVHLLFGVTGHQGKVLISYSESAKPIPVTRLYLYDMETGTGHLIEDGRIAGSYALSSSEGFII